MEKLSSYERLIQKGSPFELQDAVIKGIPCKIFPRGPQTLRDVFMKAASFAGREFIIKDDSRLTFGQAFQRGNHFALFLRQKYDIKKGSRVALMAWTGPECAVVFMVLCFAGAVPIVIPADMEGRAALNVIEITNCVLVVTDLPSAGKINVSGIEPPVVIVEMRRPDTVSYTGHESLAGFSIFNLSDVPDDKNVTCDEICVPTPEDDALISFTSGTTGAPKGVVLSHRNMTTGLMNMMLGGFLMSFRAAMDKQKQPPNAQPCSLLLSPFSHIGGYSQLMLMCYLGGKIVLMQEWDAQSAIALIENERVRSLSGLSPAMATDLLHTNQSTDSLRSLTNLNIHGVALHRKFISELANEFSHISLGTGYGMTETCGAVSVASGMDLLDNSEFNGQVLPSVDIKIVDHDGHEAARGNRGEIWVRGAMVMQGYCSGQDGSNLMLEDGWLKTGDLGYVDHAGNLYVAGRLDSRQIGKKQVSFSELERLICELNAIDEAVVLEITDSGLGAGITVAIVPNRAIQIDKNDLIREVSDYLKPYTDGVSVVIMNDIPRTASGKADRRALQMQIKEG